MAATLRELRQRKKSVSATMKITKAMELIAASRVMKAQQRAKRAVPYNDELVRAVSTVVSHTDADHPLTVEAENPTRAAVLLIASDRGLAGAYSHNVIRKAEGLIEKLQAEGKTVELFTTGSKTADYFAFRDIPVERGWTGFSDHPTYADAKEIGQRMIDEFLTPTEEGGVDELHLVFTRFRSMISQQTQIVRMLPLEVVESEEESATGLVEYYNFEPNANVVLDALMPMYIITQVHFALMAASASELAARQQAMHSATDNAKQLIDQLTRDANQARQAEITQEINEIVGGAGALAGA